MLWKNLLSGCAIALSLLGVAAHADVFVSGQSSGGSVLNNGAYEVDVSAAAGATITVTVTNASPIRWARVTCTGSATGDVTLVFAGSLGSIAEISRVSSSTSELWLGSLTCPSLGVVSVNSATQLIASANTAGDITGPITILGTNHNPSASVTRIASVHGSITGTIISVLPVAILEAREGTIGTSGALVTISTTGTLGDIKAKEIHATISVNSGTGDINSLVTNYMGSSGGVFVGSLACRNILGVGSVGGFGFDVLGDLDADVTLSAAMTSPMRIGGSLLASSDILLPNKGLTRQIIINANNSGATWAGDVKVNGVAIMHDANGVYTNLPTDLGGGSVGLATFRLHPQGCVPQAGAQFFDAYFDPTWIGEGDPPCTHNFRTAVVRHFGPVSAVTPPPTTAGLLKVEREWMGCGLPPCGSPVETVTAQFTAAIEGDADGALRLVKVRRLPAYNGGVWDAGYTYFISLAFGSGGITDTTLQSDAVTQIPRVPWYVYSFTLFDGCAQEMDSLFDQNGDGSLTAEDLGAWPGDNPDVSANGAVTAFDLYKLLCGYRQRNALPR